MLLIWAAVTALEIHSRLERRRRDRVEKLRSIIDFKQDCL
jgi:hypothetical protein